MSTFKTMMRSGHWPTLAASFLYFDFTFAIWVLNGAMAPFISESYKLSPAQKGFMVSVPIIAGALMRFPLGVLSQYIGRKNAAHGRDGAHHRSPSLFGYYFVDSYDSVLAMGVLLGIAGASFGVALSLGSGWYPAAVQGPGHGHRRRRQLGHGAGRAVRAAAGQKLRLADGLRAGRLHHAAADDRDVVSPPRSRPTRPSMPPSASTSPACSRRTAGPSA